MDAPPCRWPRRRRKRSLRLRIDGRDPAEEKRQSRRRLVVDRVDDLVETFIREHVAKIRNNRRITSLLRRDVIPYWGAKSVHEIKKRDVSDLVSLIAQRNAHASHRLLKATKDLLPVVRGPGGHRLLCAGGERSHHRIGTSVGIAS